MSLQRLVLTSGPEGIEARALYRTQAGPGPNTKARRREVTQLVRTGLEQALAALEDGMVEAVGTSGFTTREDTFLCTGKTPDTPGIHKKPTKGVA
jgi:hypothetical protein